MYYQVSDCHPQLGHFRWFSVTATNVWILKTFCYKYINVSRKCVKRLTSKLSQQSKVHRSQPRLTIDFFLTFTFSTGSSRPFSYHIRASRITLTMTAGCWFRTSFQEHRRFAFSKSECRCLRVWTGTNIMNANMTLRWLAECVATEVNSTGHATKLDRCLPYCYFERPVIECLEEPPRPLYRNESSPDVYKVDWTSNWDGETPKQIVSGNLCLS